MQGQGQQNSYFLFPDRSIGALPLEDGERLSFTIVEVGCKQRGKRSQLKNKRELLFDYWTENYSGIGWYPEIFRIVAHYEPYRPLLRCDPEYMADRVIVCNYITEDILLDMDDPEKQKLYSTVKNDRDIRSTLEELIEGARAEPLHSMIVDYGDRPGFAYLRGMMAEVVIQKYLQKCKPDNMNIHRNGDIKHFNEIFDEGTEVDAVGISYGTLPFYELIENLSRVDCLRVEEDISEDMMENDIELPN